MKRFFVISLVIVIIFMFILIVANRKNIVNMNFAETAEMIYQYDNTNIENVFSQEELKILCNIFDGKRLYKDALSCGFTENVAIKVNDSQTFCIACDTCPIIYWKEKDRFFYLSEEEKEQLYKLLEEYGFSFPCI